MSVDAQFIKDPASEDNQSFLEAGQGLVWPTPLSLPNMFWPGFFKLSPFFEFFLMVCDVDVDETLEPDEVRQVASTLSAYVQQLGLHGDEDDIQYVESDEDEVLPYKWVRDLSILFTFAAQEGMYLSVY